MQTKMSVPPRKVGLKDIAERLGVSVTTVARALHKSPLTSAATTARVEAAASEMGYVRNLEGVRLRTGQTFVIAALLKFPSNTEVGDPTLLGLLQGIHDRCSKSDYSVRAIVSSSVEEDMAELEKLIRNRSADAVVLDYTTPQDLRVERLLDAKVPFVTYGRTELPAEHPFMDIDNEHAAWQGAKALIDAGCKRIALLDGDLRLNYVQQRLRGYERALKDAAIPIDVALICHFEPDAKQARVFAARLCEAHEVDGMLCVNDAVLIGAQAGVRDVDPAKLDHVRFAVRGGTELGKYLRKPPFISYYSRVEAGQHLGDLILRRLNGDPVETLQVIGRTELR